MTDTRLRPFIGWTIRPDWAARVSTGAFDAFSSSDRRRIAAENPDSYLNVTRAGEDYPDAQLLRDRLRVALRRWPRSEALPEGVVNLSRAVEAYYESGENPRVRAL